jgi:hypothetical protein
MHSTIAVAGFRQIEPDALDRLLIGEAIRQFAFCDPAVRAMRNTWCYTKKQSAAFESLSGRGFFLWPLCSRYGSLQDDLGRILYPGTRIVQDEEQNMGAPPPDVKLAAETISTVFGQIVGFLNRKQLLAHDETNNEFDRWGRPGLAIDVQTSDLYDGSGLLRRSLRLSLPDRQRGSHSVPSSPDSSLAAVPEVDTSKHDGSKASSKAESDCKKELIEFAASHPDKHPHGTKAEACAVAVEKFHGLKQRGYDRAWHDVVRDHKVRWDRPGAPRGKRSGSLKGPDAKNPIR